MVSGQYQGHFAVENARQDFRGTSSSHLSGPENHPTKHNCPAQPSEHGLVVGSPMVPGDEEHVCTD